MTVCNLKSFVDFQSPVDTFITWSCMVLQFRIVSLVHSEARETVKLTQTFFTEDQQDYTGA